MTTPIHDTIHVQRHYPVPVQRVFAAWADPEARKRWEPTPPGLDMHYDQMGFEVGFEERSRMTQGDTELASFRTRFMDIVDNERIITSGVIISQGTTMSVSQNTIEFRASDGGTLLVCTEQIVWLHGHSMRGQHEGGWGTLLDRLGREFT